MVNSMECWQGFISILLSNGTQVQPPSQTVTQSNGRLMVPSSAETWIWQYPVMRNQMKITLLLLCHSCHLVGPFRRTKAMEHNLNVVIWLSSFSVLYVALKGCAWWNTLRPGWIVWMGQSAAMHSHHFDLITIIKAHGNPSWAGGTFYQTEPQLNYQYFSQLICFLLSSWIADDWGPFLSVFFTHFWNTFDTVKFHSWTQSVAFDK